MPSIEIVPAKIVANSDTYNFDNSKFGANLCDSIVGQLYGERSKILSDKITVTRRKKYKEGEFSFAYSSTLGFKKPTSDEKIGIDDTESQVVKRIFSMFLDGETYTEIAQKLTDEMVERPMGGTDWRSITVKNILQNEKYAGNVLLQKSVAVERLSRVRVENEGQAPKYYHTGTHKAIIDYPVFALVQSEIRRRECFGRRLKPKLLLSCRLACGECGEFYKCDENNVWKCKNDNCKTSTVNEITIKNAFVIAFNQLHDKRKSFLANIDKTISQVIDTTKIDGDIAAAKENLSNSQNDLQNLITKNSRIALDQDEYSKEFDALNEQYLAAKNTLDALEIEKAEHIAEQERLRQFASWLVKSDAPIRDFSLLLWYATVDVVIVEDTGFTFRFNDGSEVEI